MCAYDIVLFSKTSHRLPLTERAETDEIPQNCLFRQGVYFFSSPKTLRSPRHYYYYRRRLVDDGRRRFGGRRRQVAWPERETTRRRRPRHLYKYV